jgi:hypothetical protein
MPAAKPFPGDSDMTCAQFAIASLDLDSAPDSPLLQAAREHLRACAHCAALQQNWQALRADLRILGQETSDLQAPSRVETSLLREFRTTHKTTQTRRTAAAAIWALAAAAVLVLAFSWVRWQNERTDLAGKVHESPVHASPATGSQPYAAAADLGDSVIASNDSGDFTLLPGSVPSNGDATVVHVEMQRAALGELGLTVNEEHAADWIQVDLLLGDDGVPQAVRLPESSN